MAIEIGHAYACHDAAAAAAAEAETNFSRHLSSLYFDPKGFRIFWIQKVFVSS